MSRKNILKSLLAVLVAIFFSSPLIAQKANNYTFTRGSEVRLSVGAFPYDMPLHSYWSPIVSPDRDYFRANDFRVGIFLPSISHYFYHQSAYLKNEYVTGAITASYHYRFSPSFEITSSLIYSCGVQNYFKKESNEFLCKNIVQQISFIPMIRWVWLNRQYVRIYGGIGVGVGMYKTNNAVNRIKYTDFIPVAHLNLFGITVGDKIYGLFELGVGVTGLVNIGMGYKF